PREDRFLNDRKHQKPTKYKQTHKHHKHSPQTFSFFFLSSSFFFFKKKKTTENNKQKNERKNRCLSETGVALMCASGVFILTRVTTFFINA
ncbi:hypothetical protein, partial [Corynebacterium diphtheriae]|uniref:hypothetical protein n=1 Tax=Corynebacterium diphtheriae TaxID=1717 RepID=UPI001C62D12C